MTSGFHRSVIFQGDTIKPSEERYYQIKEKEDEEIMKMEGRDLSEKIYDYIPHTFAELENKYVTAYASSLYTFGCEPRPNVLDLFHLAKDEILNFNWQQEEDLFPD